MLWGHVLEQHPEGDLPIAAKQPHIHQTTRPFHMTSGLILSTFMLHPGNNMFVSRFCLGIRDIPFNLVQPYILSGPDFHLPRSLVDPHAIALLSLSVSAISLRNNQLRTALSHFSLFLCSYCYCIFYKIGFYI